MRRTRPTRQPAKTQSAASQSATPTTTSPIFSNKTSIQSTPATSDVEEDVKKAPIQPRRSMRARVTNQSKRQHESDESDPEDAPSKQPNKRRARNTVKLAVKAEPPVPKPAKNINKGKAPVKLETPPPIVEDEDEIIPETDLEFDEQASIHESDDGGFEFLTSDVEIPPLTQNEDLSSVDNSDDERLMIEAAVEASLETSRLSQSHKNGSSSAGASTSISRSAGAALRAAAAERRFAQSKKEVIDVDAYPSSSQSESEFELSDLSDDELPDGDEGNDKDKGKGKYKEDNAPKRRRRETIQQRRQRIREERSLARLERGARSKEEAAMVRRLGRKLTYAEKSTVALHRFHPDLRDIWGDIERNIPIVVPEKAEPPENLKVTLLPFQLESLFWMKKQETGEWRGGVLADEMGMGKTIQMIALLCSDMGARPNLVVAPTVAVIQWRNEVEAHSDGLKTLIWHGATREANINEIKKYDVVLTTYAVLESCFRKQHNGFKRKGKIIKEKSLMHQIKWNRVILDEAHSIKDRATNTAKATFELQAKYRWCLSGTPLQNRVGELYSLIRFLGGDPLSYYFCKKCDCKSLHWKFSDKRSCDDCGHSPMQHTCFWNNEILTPIQKNGMVGPGVIAFKKLRVLLDRMMLRRTKVQRADDLGLPPRTVIIRRDYFSPEEKELYLSLFSDAKRQFTRYVDMGTVLNNYSNIFSLLTRMRQMACHPDLVLKSKNNIGRFTQEDGGEATVCRVCNDIAEDAIQSKCRHVFDRECIRQYLESTIEQNPVCPVCHVPLTIDLEAPALELEENVKSRQGILGRLDLEKWCSSSKIEALVEELTNLRRQDATTKSIVFSQFVNFLDLIAYRLQKEGFVICRLEGTMSPQARNATIQYFMNNVHVTVFLVSLKAGGVALNLTEASRVYLMDSWWNPAVEYQAMDRIHRLGQRRPVQAIKLVVEDSIESRIVQLQEKKAAMVDATLSADDSAMGRLTPEDLGFLFRL